MDLAYGRMVRIDGVVDCVIHRNNMSESANVVNALQTELQPRTAKNPQLLARMVIRENKSFKESAIAAGYAPSVAGRGMKALVAASSSVAAAVRKETNSLISLDQLKPLAVQRLHAEITNPRSSMGMKAIELAGRFKETDWWVRNQDINIGVFGALGESGQVLDAQVLPDDDSSQVSK